MEQPLGSAEGGSGNSVVDASEHAAGLKSTGVEKPNGIEPNALENNTDISSLPEPEISDNTREIPIIAQTNGSYGDEKSLEVAAPPSRDVAGADTEPATGMKNESTEKKADESHSAPSVTAELTNEHADSMEASTLSQEQQPAPKEDVEMKVIESSTATSPPRNQVDYVPEDQQKSSNESIVETSPKITAQASAANSEDQPKFEKANSQSISNLISGQDQPSSSAPSSPPPPQQALAPVPEPSSQQSFDPKPTSTVAQHQDSLAPQSLPSSSDVTINQNLPSEEINSGHGETADIDMDNSPQAARTTSVDKDTASEQTSASAIKRDIDPNSAEPQAKRARVSEESTDGIFSVEKTQDGAESPILLVSHEKPSTGSDLPLRNGAASIPQTNGLSASRPHNNNGMYIDTQMSSSAPSSVPMSRDQHRFLLNLVKTLKKHKAAIYFVQPVDANALGIPHYWNIITKPSDLGTVDRNLTASKPGTPNAPYISVHDVVADLDLIWNNSDTFNGPDHQVSQMGHQIRDVFRKNFRNLPPAFSAEPAKSAVSKKATGNGHSQTPKSATDSSRPKRETHAPVKSIINYDEKTPRSARKKSSGFMSDEQSQFCKSVLNELNKSKHAHYAYPFLEPVDPIALGIPQYRKIIKEPMDLLTMRNKLENGVYNSPKDFEDDFHLIVNNCHTFNPPGTEVAQAGSHLERAFLDKWRNLPSRSSGQVHIDSDSDEEAGGLSTAYSFIKNQIAMFERDMNKLSKESPAYSMLEQQVAKLRLDLTHLKPAKKPVKPQPVKKASYQAPAPAAPRVPKQPKTPRIDDEEYEPTSKPKKTTKKKKKPASDSEDYVDESEQVSPRGKTEITYAQKEELAHKINRLDDSRLAEAIKIIQEGTTLSNEQEEIELDIDILPPATLYKLYGYVVGKPAKARPKKPRAPGMVKKTGTGGLKRSVMDEDIASQEIRDMQAKLAAFDSTTAPPTPIVESTLTSPVAEAPAVPAAAPSEAASDEDDAASDSSVSDA